MTVDTVVQNVLKSGLTPQLILDICIVIFGILIVLWIRNWAIRYLAHMKFKGSMDISKDVVVREFLQMGYIDFFLESVDRTSIILRSIDGKLKKIIPTATANDRDWVIVQRQDESILTRDMKSQKLSTSLKNKELKQKYKKDKFRKL